MSDYTHDIPNEALYLNAVLNELQQQGFVNLHKLLSGSKCSINDHGTFSRRRWNASWTTVSFEVPSASYKPIAPEESVALKTICDKVMPPQAGLDVMQVQIRPSLYEDTNTLDADLHQAATTLQSATADFPLPNDILTKGTEMADVYLYLYAVENYLRLFIERVASEAHGQEFFSKLKIPNGVKSKITVRKEAEAKNDWISVRGGSDLFYLDFKELGDVISNNWDLFTPYFPDQAWIIVKVNELASCRNLVAHNSYLEQHEKDIIKVDFTSIRKQLNPHTK